MPNGTNWDQCLPSVEENPAVPQQTATFWDQNWQFLGSPKHQVFGIKNLVFGICQKQPEEVSQGYTRSLAFVKTTHTVTGYRAHSAAQSTGPRLGRQKTERWKIDCERRREEHKTPLRFPFPKTLNYYWLLIFYFNIVHSCGPIRNKSLWFGMCT